MASLELDERGADVLVGYAVICDMQTFPFNDNLDNSGCVGKARGKPDRSADDEISVDFGVVVPYVVTAVVAADDDIVASADSEPIIFCFCIIFF